MENFKKNIDECCEKYLDDNWDQIVSDIKELVEIPSSAEDESAPQGAIDCMNAALSIARRFGFQTQSFEDKVGIADINGKSKTQIGFIGHCDTVPAGPGWNFDPCKLTIKDGYMIGRGVLDDKGPTIIMLHAINFWLQQNVNMPYSIRFLFGTDEETGCTDVQTFVRNCDQPKIVISPDAEFPVAYGEKGLTRFKIKKQITDGKILKLHAGQNDNAVTGEATAILNKDNVGNLEPEKNIDIKIDDKQNTIQIVATGKTGHSAHPQGSIDAIKILGNYLLKNDCLSIQEKEIFEFLLKFAGIVDGSGLGIDCEDEHFGNLTIVPSILRYDGKTLSIVIDCRFPQKCDIEQTAKKIKSQLPENCEFENYMTMHPLFLNPESDLINALVDAYESATGEPATKFTMGGATYSRFFDCGTCFGPHRPWIAQPDWVGTLHGADEGIAISEMKLWFKIYVTVIKKLMELDLNNVYFVQKTKQKEQ